MSSEDLLHHVVDAHYLPLFTVGGVTFFLTKQLLMLWIAAAATAAIGLLAARGRGRVATAVEALVVGLRDEILAPAMGEEKARAHLPFFLTLTSLILTANILGLVPSVPGLYEGATATGNFSINLGLASIVFLYGVGCSIRYLGPAGYLKQWAPHGVPLLLVPVLWVIEWAGMLIKHAVLAIRLTANMVAGHLVLFAILGMIIILKGMIPSPPAHMAVSAGPVLLALGIYLLEVLVAFIQTGVFVILSAIFFGMTVVPHGGDHHDEEHAHAH